MIRASLIFLLMSLLLGCANNQIKVGPIASPNFPQLVAKAMAVEDGRVHLFGPGSWQSIALADLIAPTPSYIDPLTSKMEYMGPEPSYQESTKFGLVVIANRAVLLQQWDDKENNVKV